MFTAPSRIPEIELWAAESLPLPPSPLFLSIKIFNEILTGSSNEGNKTPTIQTIQIKQSIKYKAQSYKTKLSDC